MTQIAQCSISGTLHISSMRPMPCALIVSASLLLGKLPVGCQVGQ
jgi:hypothetical protein